MINNKKSKLLIQPNKNFSSYLPYEIEWTDMNFLKTEKIDQVFFFLDNNYIEDRESTFRFHYMHEFLSLVLKAPGWSPFLGIGLKYKRSEKLIGIIISMPKEIVINGNMFCAPEINFLCLDKKLRNKRFVNMVIKQIERRLNLIGVKKAIYTTGLNLPKSIFSCNYYHYPINKHKLIAFGYLSIFNKFRKLQTHTTLELKSQFTKKSKKINYKILRKKLNFFKSYRYFKTSDYLYWFKTLPGVIYFIDFENFYPTLEQEIFIFYSLPSKFVNKKKNIFLYGVYVFYKTNVFLNKNISTLITKISERLGFDIINILEFDENKKKLSKINFVKGTGKLNYHIFNYKEHKVNWKQNGLQLF